MIIFGHNTRLINMQSTPKVQCQNCEETGYIKMSRYVKYFHLFWIPVFPYSTSGLCQCDNCETILDFEEMSRNTQKNFNQFKEFARLPIWSFAGVILISLLISWIVVSEIRKDNLTKEYAESPKKGDVCYIKKATMSFSTVRVTEVFGDSILINFNDYVTDRQSNLKDLDGSSNYSQDTITISKKYLIGMLKSEQIIQIIRK